MRTPIRFKAETKFHESAEKKANTNLPVMARVGNHAAGAAPVAGRPGWYHIRLVNDGNRLTQCKAEGIGLMLNDYIYVIKARDRNLTYYEFHSFIQSTGGLPSPLLYARGLVIPDNVAQGFYIVDDDSVGAGSPEYLRIVTTDGGQAVEFNFNDNDVNFIINANAVAGAFDLDGATGAITLAGPSMTVPATWDLVVADNVADAMSIDDVGGIEYMRVVSTNANPNVAFFPAGGGVVSVGAASTTTDRWLDIDGSLAGSPVYGAVIAPSTATAASTTYALHVQADVDAAVAATNAIGLSVGDSVVGGGGSVGTVYGVYVAALSAGSVNNWAVYTVGTTRSYFGGDVSVGTVNNLAQFTVDQSGSSGAQPAVYLDQGDVSEQHIVCSMNGIDQDFPAIIELNVTGAPTLWWDESENSFALTHSLLMATGTFIGISNTGERIIFDSAGGDISAMGADFGVGTQTPTAVDGGIVVEVSNATGAEVILTRADTNIADNDFVGGLVFKNTDSSGVPPHEAGIKGRANGVSGFMDLEFYAGRNEYESDTPQMVILGTSTLGYVGIGAIAPGSLTEWNMADQDVEFVDAHNATAVSGTVTDVIEVQIGGNTGYVAVYDGYTAP